jgi:transcriptional regulator with XRE-family HTH domain
MTGANADRRIGLATVRKMRGLSVRQLAAAMGYNHSWLSRVERGEMASWPAFRRKAAQVLGADESLLFGTLAADVAAQPSRVRAGGATDPHGSVQRAAAENIAGVPDAAGHAE